MTLHDVAVPLADPHDRQPFLRQRARLLADAIEADSLTDVAKAWPALNNPFDKLMALHVAHQHCHVAIAEWIWSQLDECDRADGLDIITAEEGAWNPVPRHWWRAVSLSGWLNRLALARHEPMVAFEWTERLYGHLSAEVQVAIAAQAAEMGYVIRAHERACMAACIPVGSRSRAPVRL